MPISKLQQLTCVALCKPDFQSEECKKSLLKCGKELRTFNTDHKDWNCSLFTRVNNDDKYLAYTRICIK